MLGASTLQGTLCYDQPLSTHEWSHFGPLCKHYVLGRRDQPNAVYEELKGYVSCDAAVLDLGSGTGISTRQLYRNGYKKIIGVDRDLLMIKEALTANTDDCSMRYIQADVSTGLPFPNEEFDLVVATSAFHWFSNPSSIREVARILKPQGYYYIIGAKGLKKIDKSTDVIKKQIWNIYAQAGVPPKPVKYAMSTARALKVQGFQIVLTKEIFFSQDFSKSEYLEKLQSQSSWNLVDANKRDEVLQKISDLLDSVSNEKGQILYEGKIIIVLAKKNDHTLTVSAVNCATSPHSTPFQS
jgi:ubiquinone/menaquinone biosynthesis C-methylase UbiE